MEEARLRMLTLIFGLIFLFFVGLFVRYQIIGPLQKEEFVLPAFSQRQKGVAVALPRGKVLDRRGVPLNQPVWTEALVALPAETGSSKDVGDIVAWVLGLPSYSGPSLPAQGENPRVIAQDLTAEQVKRALDASRRAPLAVVPMERRYGPHSLARHVVGYVRTNAYSDQADNLGEAGLERRFQEALAGGRPPWVGFVATGEGSGVPGTGLRIGVEVSRPPDLVTTLDAHVQEAVEAVLDEFRVRKGAVVVLDVATGDVLAMASRPEFDQNHPESSIDDSDAPFVNRAVSAFPPGSVFKPVIVSFALERGCVSPDESFLCQGQVVVGGRVIACGNTKEGHGEITLKEALAHSCNSTLVQIGLRLEPLELVDYVRKCGFGVLSDIPLDEEVPGALPDPFRMYAGDLANLSIGQGYLTVTPLQVAAFYRAIAAGGLYVKPRLVLADPAPVPVRLFSEDTANFLQGALLLATRQGTATEAYLPRIGSAGKTGTAETGEQSRPPHALFAGWTPVLAPKYVICVFVEEGGDGPTIACPIFREIASRIQR